MRDREVYSGEITELYRRLEAAHVSIALLRHHLREVLESSDPLPPNGVDRHVAALKFLEPE